MLCVTEHQMNVYPSARPTQASLLRVAGQTRANRVDFVQPFVLTVQSVRQPQYAMVQPVRASLNVRLGVVYQHHVGAHRRASLRVSAQHYAQTIQNVHRGQFAPGIRRPVLQRAQPGLEFQHLVEEVYHVYLQVIALRRVQMTTSAPAAQYVTGTAETASHGAAQLASAM